MGVTSLVAEHNLRVNGYIECDDRIFPLCGCYLKSELMVIDTITVVVVLVQGMCDKCVCSLR